MPGKTPEKIDVTPKKMPDVPKDKIKPPPGPDKGPSEVNLSPNFAPNTIQVPTPSIEVVPVPTPAPRVEGGRRDPF